MSPIGRASGSTTPSKVDDAPFRRRGTMFTAFRARTTRSRVKRAFLAFAI
jgi:hypothetical protein